MLPRQALNRKGEQTARGVVTIRVAVGLMRVVIGLTQMHVAVGLLLVAVGLMRAVVDLEASEAGTTDLLVLNSRQGLFR